MYQYVPTCLIVHYGRGGVLEKVTCILFYPEVVIPFKLNLLYYIMPTSQPQVVNERIHLSLTTINVYRKITGECYVNCILVQE